MEEKLTKELLEKHILEVRQKSIVNDKISDNPKMYIATLRETFDALENKKITLDILWETYTNFSNYNNSSKNYITKDAYQIHNDVIEAYKYILDNYIKIKIEK